MADGGYVMNLMLINNMNIALSRYKAPETLPESFRKEHDEHQVLSTPDARPLLLLKQLSIKDVSLSCFFYIYLHDKATA